MAKNFKTAVAALAFGALFGTSAAEAQTSETWKPIGTGLIRDDVITSFYIQDSFWEFPAEIEESEQTPGRYRILNAYKNCPSVGGPEFPAVDNYLVVDASDPVHVYIEPACVNYYIGEGQVLCLWTMADDYYNNRYGNWELADKEGICGRIEDGTITFPARTLLAGFIEETAFNPSEHDIMWKQVNTNSMFRIKLPGTPNTDIGISLVGINQDKTGVQYEISIPADTEYAKIGVFEGEYTDSMRAAVENDETETFKCEKSQTFTVPFEKDGIYTLVAVPYVNGKSYRDSYTTSEWSYSEAEWRKAGKAKYTEAILSSNELSNYGFIIDEYEYEVDVEQGEAQPWMIRLTDPYGPECYPYATDVNYDSKKKHYMCFDLSDFSCVDLKHTEDIGLDLSQGRMSVRSNSDLYMNDRPFGDNMTKEEYKADSSLPKCRYDAQTKTIVFEPNSIRLLFPDRRPDAWYYANMNGHAKVSLPSDIDIKESSVAAIEAEAQAEAEYFTIDGIKADCRNLDSGIYIVRKGNETSKVIIR